MRFNAFRMRFFEFKRIKGRIEYEMLYLKKKLVKVTG